MLSAYCICCIYSNALQASFIMKANNMNPSPNPMGERKSRTQMLLIERKGLILSIMNVLGLSYRLDSDICQQKRNNNLCSVQVQTLHAQHKFVPLQHVDFSPYPDNIVLKMLSPYYVCCIYLNVLLAYFIIEANTMKLDQTEERV